MKPFKTAAAGDSPAPRPEGTSVKERHDPTRPAAAPLSGPVVLTNIDAERLRGVCLELMSLADELGLGGTRIMIHNLTEASAFEVFPSGERFELTSRSASWDFRNGEHTVYLFVPAKIGDAA